MGDYYSIRMGRTSQERMTGRTFEERRQRAEKFSIVKTVKRILRFNKGTPKLYANVRRHGNASINPRLLVVEELS